MVGDKKNKQKPSRHLFKAFCSCSGGGGRCGEASHANLSTHTHHSHLHVTLTCWSSVSILSLWRTPAGQPPPKWYYPLAAAGRWHCGILPKEDSCPPTQRQGLVAAPSAPFTSTKQFAIYKVPKYTSYPQYPMSPMYPRLPKTVKKLPRIAPP